MIKVKDLNNDVVEIKGEFCNPSDFIYGEGNYKKLVIVPSQEILLSPINQYTQYLKKIVIKRKGGIVFHLYNRRNEKKTKINTSMCTLQEYVNAKHEMGIIYLQLAAILQMVANDLESDELIIPSYNCFLK